ncbi:hypothetical protein QBC45DRAFT_422450 [Copromyces sp. CBS 386.78]|nr:hypothetical protein QBC45DRAFT_422450 [Copromyces sp. CBS 386.78]
MFGSNTIKPSLYQNMPSEGGNSTFTMIPNPQPRTTKTMTTTTTGACQQRPPTPPATTPVAEATFSTATTVVGDETLPPTPAETLVNDTPFPTPEETEEPEEPEEPKEPCISFEKDFDPKANMHDLARRLVKDRLAQGFDRPELLKEQLALRDKAKVRQASCLEHDAEQDEEQDKPLPDPFLNHVVPDVRSDEFRFYTAIILTLEDNPIMSTSRRGIRSRFPESPSPIGHGCSLQ